MKKIDLGQTINTLANIGVIAGIVFLGIEIQQNSRVATAQAEFSVASVRMQQARDIATNPELANIRIKVLMGAELSFLEEVQLAYQASEILVSLEWEFLQVDAGNLEDNGTLRPRTRNLLNGNFLIPQEVVLDRWERTRSSFHPDFVSFINDVRTAEQ
jgi:hypothetical protein